MLLARANARNLTLDCCPIINVLAFGVASYFCFGLAIGTAFGKAVVRLRNTITNNLIRGVR